MIPNGWFEIAGRFLIASAIISLGTGWLTGRGKTYAPPLTVGESTRVEASTGTPEDEA